MTGLVGRTAAMSLKVFVRRMSPTTSLGSRSPDRFQWALDVVFHEDLTRLRTDNGPQNMATIKPMVMNLIRRASDEDSLKIRRKAAAWKHDDLRAIVTQTAQSLSSDCPAGALATSMSRLREAHPGRCAGRAVGLGNRRG
ncbi:hypothetical protein MKL09_09625 [Methylobacterium sp. J-048]|uniref:hypothetical protein n=1 Tax=Methylobacterium sp. J-048 TaxID=2836635 RepID=UPI001FBA7438|nr:hypothetical protein [Methylobacterium sp. J-048]MCJ2056814.1 hypothetical protein [Methylobacterium sp. J-048]